MSKTKLALLVFALAFGVNIVAFLSSKKTYTVDEVKNVWLYELPPSASPLDSYSSLDIGPDQGIIGTLFKPNYLEPASALHPLLAATKTWDEATHSFSFTLLANANYSDGTPIVSEDYVKAHQFLVQQLPQAPIAPLWQAWKDAVFEAVSPSQLKITWAATAKNFPKDFSSQFESKILTHVWSGPIHPKNLASMQKHEKITEGWISSGPYKVRKWNPKEIILVSRDQFPVMMTVPFFRTLRFQSAPVKNPSCEFMEGKMGEEKPSPEHREFATSETMHVLWVCRSWKDPKHFCFDPLLRANLKIVLSSTPGTEKILTGQIIKYRIPFGSDAFRAQFKTLLNERVSAAGGKIEEISYFFKPSSDADLELQFVATPRDEDSQKMAETFALLSTRLGEGASQQLNLVGSVETFASSILMKNMSGETFEKVFLEPDLAEKKLGL